MTDLFVRSDSGAWIRTGPNDAEIKRWNAMLVAADDWKSGLGDYMSANLDDHIQLVCKSLTKDVYRPSGIKAKMFWKIVHHSGWCCALTAQDAPKRDGTSQAELEAIYRQFSAANIMNANEPEDGEHEDALPQQWIEYHWRRADQAKKQEDASKVRDSHRPRKRARTSRKARNDALDDEEEIEVSDSLFENLLRWSQPKLLDTLKDGSNPQVGSMLPSDEYPGIVAAYSDRITLFQELLPDNTSLKKDSELGPFEVLAPPFELWDVLFGKTWQQREKSLQESSRYLLYNDREDPEPYVRLYLRLIRQEPNQDGGGWVGALSLQWDERITSAVPYFQYSMARNWTIIKHICETATTRPERPLCLTTVLRYAEAQNRLDEGLHLRKSVDDKAEVDNWIKSVDEAVKDSQEKNKLGAARMR